MHWTSSENTMFFLFYETFILNNREESSNGFAFDDTVSRIMAQIFSSQNELIELMVFVKISKQAST